MAETQTWYEVSKYRSDITPVEVVSYTDKTVLLRTKTWKGISEHRSAIASQFSQYFQTYEQAHEFICSRLERQIEQGREAIKEKEAALAKLRSKAMDGSK